MFKEKIIAPTGIASYSQLSLPVIVDINTRAVTNPLVIILFSCRVSFVEFVYHDVVTITQWRECGEGLYVRVDYISLRRKRSGSEATLSGNAHVITRNDIHGCAHRSIHIRTHVTFFFAYTKFVWPNWDAMHDRMKCHSIRTARDISRARIATCSLRTPTGRQAYRHKENYSIDYEPVINKAIGGG